MQSAAAFRPVTFAARMAEDGRRRIWVVASDDESRSVRQAATGVLQRLAARGRQSSPSASDPEQQVINVEHLLIDQSRTDIRYSLEAQVRIARVRLSEVARTVAPVDPANFPADGQKYLEPRGMFPPDGYSPEGEAKDATKYLQLETFGRAVIAQVTGGQELPDVNLSLAESPRQLLRLLSK
jgi:hypothetical protein